MELFEKMTTIIIILLVIALMFFLTENWNRERCYNLPLNEFYEDYSCQKYIGKYGDIN